MFDFLKYLNENIRKPSAGVCVCVYNGFGHDMQERRERCMKIRKCLRQVHSGLSERIPVLKGAEDMPKKGCCRECKYADWDKDGCTCMIDGILVYDASDYTCDQYLPAKPMTNADRIRQMTDEELAECFGGYICDNHRSSEDCERFKDCEKCKLSWIRQEVSEDAGAD